MDIVLVKHIVMYYQNLKMSFCLSLQEQFPTLVEKPYPTWIYVIIFILAGIPSIAVPLVAVWKCLKPRKSDKSDLHFISDQIHIKSVIRKTSA